MFGWGSDRKENINGHECQVMRVLPQISPDLYDESSLANSFIATLRSVPLVF